MLVTLRVKNLALVENVRVDFEPGLNVITGETGAGKSILIGALALLLGDRADRRMIRSGADACGAEAVFHLKDPKAVNGLLAELGVDALVDGQLIVRRIVKAEGNGQNLINDTPVTIQALKRLGELLLDLHGPHEHQSLLNPDYQLAILDAYGGLIPARESCAEVYRAIQLLKQEQESLQGSEEDLAAQLDLLRHRVREIGDAAPVEGEDEQIAQEQRVAGSAQQLLEVGGAAIAALTEGEANAADLLGEALRRLEEVARLLPAAEAWRQDILDIARRLRETGAAIQAALEQVDCNPERLQWLDQRLATYQRLKKKYGGSTASILSVLEDSTARLHKLESRGKRLGELKQAEEKRWAEYRKLAATLTQSRKEAALRLAAAITGELRSLGFPKSAFAVDVGPGEPRVSGADAVEYGFAPNAGEPSQPLRVIASSGEMSRVMLATKAVLSQHDRIPILVFDEIDANLGGETGLAVGRKLRGLGRRHQVLCITHLPQVAAHGQTHYAVTKHESAGRTVSEISKLADAQRAEELARMMGGKALTKSVLQHARELLEQAG